MTINYGYHSFTAVGGETSIPVPFYYESPNNVTFSFTPGESYSGLEVEWLTESSITPPFPLTAGIVVEITRNTPVTGEESRFAPGNVNHVSLNDASRHNQMVDQELRRDAEGRINTLSGLSERMDAVEQDVAVVDGALAARTTGPSANSVLGYTSSSTPVMMSLGQLLTGISNFTKRASVDGPRANFNGLPEGSTWLDDTADPMVFWRRTAVVDEWAGPLQWSITNKQIATSLGLIRPEDNGSVGLGDDWAAVQAAANLAEAQGKPLFLYPGRVYECSSAKLTLNCAVVGNAATIKGWVESAVSSVTLSDFKITSFNPLALYLHGSLVSGKKDVELDRVRITFDASTNVLYREAVNATYIENLKITGCAFDYGIALVECKNYTIQGNTLSGDNFQNYSELIHASINSVGVIQGNTFKESRDNYIDLYSSGARTVVSGNRFLSCSAVLGTCIEIKVSLTDTSNTSSDANGWSEQIIIEGNYFGGTKASAPIFTTIISIYHIDARGVPTFSWGEVPRNIIVANNIFDGFDPTLHGSGYFAAVYAAGVSGLHVTDNIFRNLKLGATVNDYSSCVWVEKSRGVKVTGNTMSIDRATGVSVHGDNDMLTIANNTIAEDLNASIKPKYGVRMSYRGSGNVGTHKNVSIVGNTIDATTMAIHQLQTNSAVDGLTVVGNTLLNGMYVEDVDGAVVNGNNVSLPSGGTYGIWLGTTLGGNISVGNVVVGNKVDMPAVAGKIGIFLVCVRASVVKGNISSGGSIGIQLLGTSTVGEMNDLIIKDNISINQIGASFPASSGVHATDSASWQSDSNIKAAA